MASNVRHCVYDRRGSLQAPTMHPIGKVLLCKKQNVKRNHHNQNQNPNQNQIVTKRLKGDIVVVVSCQSSECPSQCTCKYVCLHCTYHVMPALTQASEWFNPTVYTFTFGRIQCTLTTPTANFLIVWWLNNVGDVTIGISLKWYRKTKIVIGYFC